MRPTSCLPSAQATSSTTAARRRSARSETNHSSVALAPAEGRAQESLYQVPLVLRSELYAVAALTGAGVVAEVIDTIKADKVITFHKRRREHSSQRTRGHRQQLTLLRVTDVLDKGADKTGVKSAVGARTKVEAADAPAKTKKPAKDAAEA